MSTEETSVTKAVAQFVVDLTYAALPAEGLRIGKRCILDGLGLVLAGSFEKCTRVLIKFCEDTSRQKGSSVLGANPIKFSAPSAALINGTAGHAMDWDDSQLSISPGRIYGLLTHPTIPPLTASLAVAEEIGRVSGKQFLTAFLAGFEVECKIAEAINPDHYKKGFHSSGTMGTFGAAMAAAKLLGLNELQIRHTIGIAASMASGIRTNFGTMTKPLHVGRAASNGVTAAILANNGFEANTDALDGPWGFFSVLGRGFDVDKISGRLGRPHTIVDPGVSIKPYPCGVLTHPSMDAMLAIVNARDLQPDDIREIVLYAGSNILNPIRYQTARDELEAKFCMPFLLAAIIRSRKAGVNEFTEAFVNAPQTQALVGRIRTAFDLAIEAKGWDKIRSRIEVVLNDGQKIIKEADERYRGGPDNPLSDEELQNKFTDCAERLLDKTARENVFQVIGRLENLEDIGELIRATQPRR
jgi:2-methylcitrate dehydratase PrpD